jgi:mycothiol synthase
MMGVEIAPLYLAEASDDELTQCHQVVQATFAVDYSEWRCPPYAWFVQQLRVPPSWLGPHQVWAARIDGRIVATATAAFPELENRHLVITTVQVPPQLRGQGIGTALLRATLPDTRAQGRRMVVGQAVRVGGDGEKWALGLGFSRVQEFALQVLVVADVDPGLWEMSVPPGFRVEQWIGAAPQSLVAGYAVARTAISDAPRGDSSRKFPDWTVQRVRDHETEARDRGAELRTVVAVHEASGTVAGLTEMEVRPSRPHLGCQLETAVLPQFRGRGLGRFIKAIMMGWLVAERPEIERVVTSTNAGNVHMIRVNHQIGYITDYVVSSVEADLETLDTTLMRPSEETTSQ